MHARALLAPFFERPGGNHWLGSRILGSARASWISYPRVATPTTSLLWELVRSSWVWQRCDHFLALCSAAVSTFGATEPD
jgi:hypothetical protein